MTTAFTLGGIAIVVIIFLMLWLLVKVLKWAFRSGPRRKSGDGFWDDLGDFGDSGGGD